MGNVAGVASAVKAQGDTSASKVYELVSLKGEGELVRLMQKARWTKQYGELDEAIINYVSPFLYNGGRGKYIPITELVKRRNRDREKGGIKSGKKTMKPNEDLAMIDMIMQENGEGPTNKHDQRKYRFQCWDLDQRGTVGETILHLCLLNATQVHADLAKRLLQHFPAMINDMYIGEEYYGETVLHLAIVNEDPAMVKYLLDLGADFQVRVCGNFFTPDDQKPSRTDCLDHEWVDLCKDTNYEGYVYWGDYPLSFAACLDQEECVRLLLARGANPNKKDTNGNTVLHMLVIHDNKGPEESVVYRKMFDLLHGRGARLDIKNRKGLTPLTLAAKLARKEMFDHISEMMREVYWLYGNVTSAGYPLTDIDTISSSGEINTNSALNLIVWGKSEGHLNMMGGVVGQLLEEKWKTFARFRFYRRFVIFVCYILFFIGAFILRPGADLCAYLDDTSELYNCNQTGPNRTEDSCYLLKVYRDEDIIRMVLEAIVAVSAIIYIYLAMKEIYHQGFVLFFTALAAAPAKALFVMSVFLVVCMIPGRAACAYGFEDVVGVLAVLLSSPYFLFFCRGLRITGPFVVMIYNMIHGDLLRFVAIYSVFLVGFSQAVYIPFRTMKDVVFNHQFEVIVGMFSMSVGDFEDLYEHFNSLSSPFNGIIKAMFVVYMIMVTLLLINMLIAMMARTYETVRFTEKEWLRQWASIVLVIERTLTTESRRDQMMKYSVPHEKKERALMTRWHQTEKEREDLRKLRLSNKISQRNMATRKQSIRKMTSQPSINISLAGRGFQNI